MFTPQHMMSEQDLVKGRASHLFSTTIALAHFTDALCCSTFALRLSMTSLEAPEPLVDLHAESHVVTMNCNHAFSSASLHPMRVDTGDIGHNSAVMVTAAGIVAIVARGWPSSTWHRHCECELSFLLLVKAVCPDTGAIGAHADTPCAGKGEEAPIERRHGAF